MVTYDFQGQVALVTGGARGIGRSHAIEFAKNGADVAVIDLPADSDIDPEYGAGSSEEAREVVDEVESRGQTGIAIGADVSNEEDVSDAVDQVVNELGQIDVLVNNAATFPVSYLLEMEEEDWDAVLDTNLKGTWLCAKHVGQHMVGNGGGGSIVNTSSTAGLKGVPKGLGHYVASKHGVIGLTKTLALELAEDDINVNAVCPGTTESEGINALVETYGEEALVEDGSELAGPFNVFEPGATIPAEDISNAVMWLASDVSNNVTGIVLPVDAGFTAK
jgi:NAD(P)-dependent dehydrogenase (short-subunit alcohol dehydrogenase family)